MVANLKLNHELRKSAAHLFHELVHECLHFCVSDALLTDPHVEGVIKIPLSVCPKIKTDGNSGIRADSVGRI